MNRSKLVILGACAIVPLIIVGVLIAIMEEDAIQDQGFSRNYKVDAAGKPKNIDLQVNSFYLAGTDDKNVYLGNITAATHLLIVPTNLKDTTHVRLELPGHETVTTSLTVRIHQPYFFLADGSRPALFRGNLGSWRAKKLIDINDYFVQIIPIGNSSFAIRSNVLGSQENILGKIQPIEPQVKLDYTLLTKQIDGVFCTDGKLLYNKELNKMIYVYFYRNSFIVADSSLKQIYQGHTIDTFTRSQLKFVENKTTGDKILTSHRFINNAACTSGDNLFICSGVPSSNDYKYALSRNAIIDVYSVTTGKYKFSFSLTDFPRHSAIHELVVHRDGKLFLLLEKNLVVYDLKTELFNDDRQQAVIVK